MTTFKIEWRNSLKGMIIWTLIFGGLIFAFAAIYPQMVTPEMKKSLTGVFASFPTGMLAAFHLNLSGPANFLAPSGFFAYYFQYMFLAACIYVVLLGTNSLVKEETDGTIDFLYAQTVTRKGILTGKFLAHLLVVTQFWLISAGIAIASFLVFRQKGDSGSAVTENIGKIFLAEYLVLLFFLALGYFFSTILHSSKQATGIGLGVVFGLYIMGMIGGLYDKLDWLVDFSPVTLGVPATVLTDGLKHGQWIALAAAIFLLLAYLIYQRKDLQAR